MHIAASASIEPSTPLLLPRGAPGSDIRPPDN
jgi:hypothetical protein